ARATYLAARLATRASDAEDAYLSVAISAPSSSPYVAESLLRVGQAEMMKGSARNAMPYLQRLVDNYPASEFAVLGKEWLARARAALPADTTRRARTSAAKPSAAGNRFAIQVAAFREKSGARAYARGISQAGFKDVRLVTTPDNALIRVRVGRFSSETAASTVLKQLQSAGYKPVVASDASLEKPVRD
ncbi:MAG TPA: SPOR domain-containing protein, partial [Longimicrobiales bacterium]